MAASGRRRRSNRIHPSVLAAPTPATTPPSSALKVVTSFDASITTGDAATARPATIAAAAASPSGITIHRRAEAGPDDHAQAVSRASAG
jgi:hypothetical protein